MREHEFGYWRHRQDVQLTTCAHCAYGGPRLVPVVLLGVNVSEKLPHGHRHIPHLSMTDKHPESITFDYRPREYGTGHEGAQ